MYYIRFVSKLSAVFFKRIAIEYFDLKVSCIDDVVSFDFETRNLLLQAFDNPGLYYLYNSILNAKTNSMPREDESLSELKLKNTWWGDWQ